MTLSASPLPVAPTLAMVRRAAEPADRVLIVHGLSKAHAMTGWRVGWRLDLALPIARINAIQGQNRTRTATLSQTAVIVAQEGPHAVPVGRNAINRQRRDAAEILSASPMQKVVRPARAVRLLHRPRGPADDKTVASRRPKAGVAPVPGSGFGMTGHLWLSFATCLRRLKERGRIVAALEMHA